MSERTDTREWEQLANCYASALYRIAEERGILYVIKEQLYILKEIFISQPELIHIFSVPSITREEKQRIVEMIAGEFDPIMQAFLGVVSNRNRLWLLPEIISAFEEEDNKRNNRVHSYITTATEIDEDIKQEFELVLGEFLQKEIIPHYQIRSEILGGFIIRSEDLLIDNSIRSKLLKLRYNLKRRGKDEVQSGRNFIDN